MKARYVLVVLGIALTTVGCGKQSPVETQPLGSSVAVSEKEFTITPDVARVKAGMVTFTVTNSGTIDHEFVVIKTDLDPTKLPMKGGVEVDETKVSSPGELEGIKPGKTKTGSFELPAGRYVLICNIEGHYSGGMRTALESA